MRRTIYLINFNYEDFLKIASSILFIESVDTLKKTKNNPNHPKITAIDNKFEPKSPSSKYCMNF